MLCDVPRRRLAVLSSDAHWQLAAARLRACDASLQAEKQSLAKQAAGEGKKEPASAPLPGGFQTHVRPCTAPLD